MTNINLVTGEVFSKFEIAPSIFPEIDNNPQRFFMVKEQNIIYCVIVNKGNQFYKECDEKLNENYSQYKGSLVKIEFSKQYNSNILLKKIHFNLNP